MPYCIYHKMKVNLVRKRSLEKMRIVRMNEGPAPLRLPRRPQRYREGPRSHAKMRQRSHDTRDLRRRRRSPGDRAPQKLLVQSKPGLAYLAPDQSRRSTWHVRIGFASQWEALIHYIHPSFTILQHLLSIKVEPCSFYYLSLYLLLLLLSLLCLTLCRIAIVYFP